MSAAVANELRMMAIKDITPAKDNPRRDVGDVTELAASIKSAGILEPLIVTIEPKATFQPRNGGGPVTMHEARHLLVIGHRRLAAAKLAGLTEVPVVVRTLSESERIEAMLIENLQRTDLAPLEEAQSFKRLLDMGCSQHKLAERIGRSQSHISKRLALLELPDVAKKALDSGGITLPDAYELTKLAAHPERVKKAIAERHRNGYYRDMNQVVEQELLLQQQEDRGAKVRRQLEAEGVKLVPAPRDIWNPPAGTQFLGSPGEYGRVGVTVDAHKKLPCHAAFIGSDGKARWICTDPKVHASPKEKAALTRELTERQRQVADKKLEREAQRERASFLEKFAQRRPAKTHVAHAIQVLIQAQSANDACHTAKVLGLEPAIVKTKYFTGRDYHKPLLKLATKKGGLEKVLVAMALARGEESCSYSYMAGQVGLLHYGFIKKVGYEPNSWERRSAKKIKSDAADEREMDLEEIEDAG